MESDNITNALGDAAQTLAREIAFCQACAEKCLNSAWEAGPERHEARRSLLNQAENFMRLSTEVATALAKLRGDANTHRQHISVERIEHSAVRPAQPVPSAAPRAHPPDAPNSKAPTEAEREALAAQHGYDADHHAFERARAALAVAQLQAELKARGEGGGVDSGKRVVAMANPDAATS